MRMGMAAMVISLSACATPRVDVVAQRPLARVARREWRYVPRPFVPVAHFTPPTAAPDGAPIGNASPSVFVASAPDARWTVLCQARADTDNNGRLAVADGFHGDTSGDRLEPYLVLGSGLGHRIDVFLGADPSGRWIAVTRDGALHVLDTVVGADATLVERDPTDDPRHPLLRPPSVSFDQVGGRIAYPRRRDGALRVVVRELVNGREREVDPGPGRLWRVELNPTGQWVTTLSIGRDTNANGVVEPPGLYTSQYFGPCRAPGYISSTWGRFGDDPILRVARVSGGRAREIDGLVTPLGDGLLVRDVGGALVLRRGEATEIVLAPASCRGRVLYADHAHQSVVVACEVGKDERYGRLEVHGPAFHRVLGESYLWPRGVESGVARVRAQWRGEPDGFEFFYEGARRRIRQVDSRLSHDVLIDFEERAETFLPNFVRATYAHESLVLLGPVRGRWRVLDLATGGERALDRAPSESRRLALGPIAVFRDAVVDLSTATTLSGAFPDALSVTRDGRLLHSASGRGFWDGPYAWRTPPRASPRHGLTALPRSTPSAAAPSRARSATP